MERPSLGGASWPPSLRRKLGIPPPSATAPPPNISKSAAGDDDSDSDHDPPAPSKNSAASSSNDANNMSARQLRTYIRESYAALTSVQRQLHRGEESYHEETFARGNVFQGFDNIWIEQNPHGNSTAVSSGGGGGGEKFRRGDSADGSSSSGGDSNNVASNSKRPQWAYVRKMPSDHRWFSSSCGTILPTGDGTIAALERRSLMRRPPTPDEGRDEFVEKGNENSAKVFVTNKAESNVASSDASIDHVKGAINSGGNVTGRAKPELALSSNEKPVEIPDKVSMPIHGSDNSGEGKNGQSVALHRRSNTSITNKLAMGDVAAANGVEKFAPISTKPELALPPSEQPKSLQKVTVSSMTLAQAPTVPAAQHKITLASLVTKEPTTRHPSTSESTSLESKKTERDPHGGQSGIASKTLPPSACESDRIRNSISSTQAKVESTPNRNEDPSNAKDASDAPNQDVAASKKAKIDSFLHSRRDGVADATVEANPRKPPPTKGQNTTMLPPSPPSLPVPKQTSSPKGCPRSQSADGAPPAAPIPEPYAADRATTSEVTMVSGSRSGGTNGPVPVDSRPDLPSTAATVPASDAESTDDEDVTIEALSKRAGTGASAAAADGGRRMSSRITRKRRAVS